MQNIKAYNYYFEQHATNLVEIAHSPTDKHFARITGDELFEGVQHKIKKVAFFLEDYNVTPLDNNGSDYNLIVGAFSIVKYLGSTPSYDEVEDAKSWAEILVRQVLAQIRIDCSFGNSLSAAVFNTSDCEMMPLSNMPLQWYGMRCEIKLQVPTSLCVDDAEWNPPAYCDAANYLVEYANGTLIESGTIPSGGNKTIKVPDPLVFVDPTYLVEYTDGELISSGTLGSGDNLVVQVPKTLTIDLPYLDGDTTNTYPIVTSNTYGIVNTITTSLTNFVIKLDGVVVTTPFTISALNSEITTEHDAATSDGVIELGGLGD